MFWYQYTLLKHMHNKLHSTLREAHQGSELLRTQQRSCANGEGETCTHLAVTVREKYAEYVVDMLVQTLLCAKLHVAKGNCPPMALTELLLSGTFLTENKKCMAKVTCIGYWCNVSTREK